MRDQKPTRLTASAQAVNVPKERSKEEHRHIVWMNYSDLFQNRDEFEAACDGYEVRKNRRRDLE